MDIDSAENKGNFLKEANCCQMKFMQKAQVNQCKLGHGSLASESNSVVISLFCRRKQMIMSKKPVKYF